MGGVGQVQLHVQEEMDVVIILMKIGVVFVVSIKVVNNKSPHSVEAYDN